MPAPQNLDLCFENGGRPTSPLDDQCQSVNEDLYAAIPAACRILELGCASGGLGERYKRSHPGSLWAGVIYKGEVRATERKRLDATYDVDLDNDSSDPAWSSEWMAVGSGYDCVVFDGLLEQVRYPDNLLKKLRNITTPDATLVCCVANGNHSSVIERLLMGDASLGQEQLADRPRLHSFSCSSLFKRLLDTGWLPDLRTTCFVTPANWAFAAALIGCARSLHISDGVAHHQFFTYQLLVVCKRVKELMLETKAPPFTVIVPVTNEVQLQLNLQKSPGLKEIGAEIVEIRNATSAADAFARGRAIASHPWVLLCHQDVYFPAGTGWAIARHLEAIEPRDQRKAVLGFAGISREKDVLSSAGLVIDRISLFDHPATDSAISIDELCVVLHRATEYELDAELGWHLWATDLCMQSILSATGFRYARILRVPLFHNSMLDQVLPASYDTSKARMLEKYPSVLGFVTLCGSFAR